MDGTSGTEPQRPDGTLGAPDDPLAALAAELDALEHLTRAALSGAPCDGHLLSHGLAGLRQRIGQIAMLIGDPTDTARPQDPARAEALRSALLRAGRLLTEAVGPTLTRPALRQAWVRQGVQAALSRQARALLHQTDAALALLSPASLMHPGQAGAGPEGCDLPDFAWCDVPAGWFLMGSDPRRDRLAQEEEQPQHRVYLGAFRIARVPVTVRQFAAFVQATGYETDAEAERSERCWQRPHGPAGSLARAHDAHPVTCVSWHDAQAFCRWAAVRLPSEAEWEKAARGADGRVYPWGDEAPDAGHANYGAAVGDTTPVGSYPAGASPHGALDMAGNVWEWTASLWGSLARGYYRYPYDPDDGREAADAPDQVLRIVRGGSFRDSPGQIRCAFRDWRYPFYRSEAIGFRVAAP